MGAVSRARCSRLLPVVAGGEVAPCRGAPTSPDLRGGHRDTEPGQSSRGACTHRGCHNSSCQSSQRCSFF